jgi:hypothetical protein
MEGGVVRRRCETRQNNGQARYHKIKGEHLNVVFQCTNELVLIDRVRKERNAVVQMNKIYVRLYGRPYIQFS